MSIVIAGTSRPKAAVPVVYATDGSAIRSKGGKVWWTGFGWVCTDGRWELGACPIPHDQIGRQASTVSELRAVWHAVHHRMPGPKGLVLLTDCTQATWYLDQWAAGDVDVMPPGYVGTMNSRRTPMLRRLAMLVAEHHPLLAWSHVSGHAGHLLNECADSLARIGRELARGAYSRPEATARGQWLVDGFMADTRLAEVA